MQTGFNVTFEIVTQESAEHGDAESRGFISENGNLRNAITDLFDTRTSHVDGVTAIEANECPVTDPRWITVNNGMEHLTGDYESRSLHFPDHITPASRCRVAKLIGCYGA